MTLTKRWLITLFLIFIYQNIRTCTSNQGFRKGVIPNGKTIKGESRKVVHGRGEPSKTDPDKKDPKPGTSKEDPSKGDSSDDEVRPRKKGKICDERICKDCTRDMENCVCEKIEGKISYCAQNFVNIRDLSFA